ncbi:MAG: class I SAM-dependent methyltransferase [Clostridia bacterium]|nr:class I SAM-dependent methyltransferase [Clostridia bacterium]
MYNAFAKYYDILMRDVDYHARADYICSLFSKYGKKPKLLLDLACGTGSFSNEFSHRGFSVIGVDISEEMLCIAQEKSIKQGNNVLYICQPAQELKLHSTVDGAVCLLDSLNHIIDYSELCEVFIKVSDALEKDALFIFDMNTVYKHKNILADNAFVIEEDGIFCVWQNFYNKDLHTTDIILDFFEKQGNKYERYSECFSERAYTKREIYTATEKAGLRIEACLGDMSGDKPDSRESRMFFVARKV